MPQLWFSIYDFSFDYKGSEPPYIEPPQFRWARDFEEQASKIKEELQAYLHKNNLTSYFNTTMVTRPNSWRTVSLKSWDIELFKNQKEFPFTSALINKYPEIVSASFNLLEAGGKILAHCGDTNGIYRCHLGLDVPEGLPACGFKVKGETRAWENNKWLVFMDAYVHEAWNDSVKDRYIFVIDVLREEFREEKTRITSTVRTSLFLQKRREKVKFIGNFSEGTIRVIAKTLRPFIQFAIWCVNFLRVY